MLVLHGVFLFGANYYHGNLLLQEDITISRKSLYLLIRKYQEHGTLHRASRTKILAHEHYQFIDQCMLDNDELTGRQLHKLVIEKYLSTIS